MARDAYGRSFNAYGRLEFPAPSAPLTADQLAAKLKRQELVMDWFLAKSGLSFEEWLRARGGQ
jgi:hypothetical protein